MVEEAPKKKGERVLWSGRTHFKILFKPLMIQILLIALHVLAAVYIPSNTDWQWWDNWGQFSIQSILVVISLIYVIVPWLRWRHGTFELTDRRVIKKWGVFSLHSHEIPLDRITAVTVERDILDRIFGCGTLVFQDASASAPNTRGSWNRDAGNRGMQGVKFYDVPGVLKVKKLIDETRYND